MLNINGTITNQTTIDLLQKECNNDCLNCKHRVLCRVVFGTYEPNSEEAKKMVNNAIRLDNIEDVPIAVIMLAGNVDEYM